MILRGKDRDSWIRHVGLLLGFRDLPEQMHRQIGRLADLRYTEQGAVEHMRKLLVTAHNTGSGQ